ncbi:protein SSUH2 [Caerostris darwini]|uniref:Protein SSUH2 n=1 Tax=Caerostris darwini TaxID=1538125 RepID=A0AAV4UUQ5_9ARAC|nr:protein SSUH2 [Caerostris darwini]
MAETTLPNYEGLSSTTGACLKNIVPLTDGQVRDACHAHAKKFFSYGSKFIREMTLTDITNDTIFHYKLESLGEKRKSINKVVAYTGQYVNTSGYAVDPWDVRVGTADGKIEFADHQIITEIPNSACIKICLMCSGSKKMSCISCNGEGSKICDFCDDKNWGILHHSSSNALRSSG